MDSNKNYGYCNLCEAKVTLSHRANDGRVYLVKHCPECGETQTLVSSDSGQYYRKQRFDTDPTSNGCSLECTQCHHHGPPHIILVEVTNSCNQICPICISSVPKTGFVFKPPLDYIQDLFERVSRKEPRPHISLFGGEPTMRDDLVDIIRLGNRYGLNVSISTNGVRLADEDYCRELLSTGVKIMFQFDGTQPETYRLLRGNTSVLSKKLKALENIRKYARAKIDIFYTIGKGINDDHVAELLQFCHERQDLISGVYFIPLAPTWDSKDIEFKWDADERLTTEDVENLISKINVGSLEFVPACALKIPEPLRWILGQVSPYEGSHPNCESVSFLVSKGDSYVPISDFLKTSLFELAEDWSREEQRIAQRSSGRNAVMGSVEKAIIYARLGLLLNKHCDLNKITGTRGLKKFMRIGGILCALRKKGTRRDTFKRATGLGPVLKLFVLPYRDRFQRESRCLKRCQAAIGFIDPETDSLGTVPICAWNTYRTEILRKIAATQ